MNAVIIQARLGSTRFPEKIIQPIYGDDAAIDILIKRLRSTLHVDYIVVATTSNPKDDKLVKYLTDKKYPIHIYRGSEDDVFQRITEAKNYICSQDERIDTIIELTSDCPFIDMDMLGHMLSYFENYHYDYFSNVVTRGFPIGYDIQIYKSKLLSIFNEGIENKNHRIHGGWNIVNYSMLCSSIKIGNYFADPPQFHPNWRIVLDYPEDLELLKVLCAHFNTIHFSLEDVIGLLTKCPELLHINENCVQKTAGTDKIKE